MQAKQLEPGMKVKMADESVKTVSSLERGFAILEREGKRRQGILINWTRGQGWSQVHPEAEVTLG